MRVTLDLDSYRVSDINEYMEERLQLIDIVFDEKFVEVKESSSGEGYHIIIYNVDCSRKEVLNFRAWLGDDPKRVAKDRERTEDQDLPFNILFNEKKGGESELIKTMKTSEGGIT